ncbi:MAG: UDP-galactose 4-epimerase [Solimicrobium sp.]|nr:UDP-galactose 4-epimerase [Solimicrobium sp.]
MILITGGTGYIGSHTAIALSNAGSKAVILDNFSNSNFTVLSRISRICGAQQIFVKGDVRDAARLTSIFDQFPITAVIHFAGLKSVGESVQQPLEYYDNNVLGTAKVLETMRRANVKTFIFSSSATVYGNPRNVPIKENYPLSATNPYGRSKLIVENILTDFYQSSPDWNIAVLRYFNPVGAHESGLIGEDPKGVPNNLLPYISQVAIGLRSKLTIFGSDYPTIDGTGVRDYIHVMDLAEGHVAALNYFNKKQGFITANLGTGHGYSVLEMVKAFEAASSRKIPYEFAERRRGDVAECWSDPTFAREILGWKASRKIEKMCTDSWHWQLQNLKGFK